MDEITTKHHDSKKHSKHEQAKEAGKKEADELKDSLQRLQAEFENYKKRTEKETIDRAKFSNADLIARLLDVVDNFELALKHECKDSEFAQGMQMVHNQLMKQLEDEGLLTIKTVGEKFDPYRHEAMLKEKSDKEENTIIEELQRGYILNGKVLRNAKVKIASK